MRFKNKPTELGEVYTPDNSWIDEVAFGTLIGVITLIVVMVLGLIMGTTGEWGTKAIEWVGTFISNII